MKKNYLVGNKNFQYFTLITALLLFPFLKGIAQVSLTTLGAAYTQNFDGLANSGTSSSVPAGWAFLETGSNLNSTYSAGNGSGNSGETFSFGATSATDRAFGSLASGSLQSKIGASFVNNTGSIITTLNISYVGEEWRLGVTGGRTDQLNFEYSLNATSLANGTWTSVSALNFITPNTSTVVGAVNGNLTGNKSSISSTINSLAIAVGGTVWVRWSDIDITGADDGLAIDDFSLTPSASAPIPPTQLVITSINPASPVAGTGFSVTVQAQDATNTVQNVLANTAFSLSTNGNAGAIGGTITGTINAGSSSVVVSGVTLSTGGTSVNITATRTSGDALSAATSSTFSVIGLATQLAFVGVPSSGYISSNIATFTVEARRADNSVDVNFNGSITVSKASGPGSLSGTTSVAAVSGVATFSSLQFDQVGTYSLSTTSGTLTPNTSSSIVISPSPVTWNFTTASATNIPANLSVSVMSQGNNNGSTPLLDNTSVSSGYTGASGNNNAGAAARTGAINTGASGSAYFEFTLTPNANYIVTLNGISFGTRSTGTGPQAFSLRSSLDSYVSNIANGTITTGSWGLKTPAVTSTSSNAGNAVTFRIYGHSGVGSPSANTANWRIDDVLLNLTVSTCTQPNISVNSGSICTGNSFTISPTGGVTYSVTGTNFTVSPTANTDYTVTGADAIGCTNTAVSSVVVNTLPTINITGTSSICIGSSTSLTASGASTYVWSDGANTTINTVSPSTTTTYTITGTDVNGCVNSTTSVLTVSNCPGPQLIAASCGATLTALDQNLGFTPVSGATNYRLEIINTQQPFSTVNVRGNSLTTFKMSWVPGIQYGRTYSIRVSAYVAGVWQAYGNTCTVTTPLAINTTQFHAGSCNVTLTSLNQNLNFTPIPAATNYRFEIVNAAQSFSVVNVRNNTLSYFNLSWVSGIQYGRTYDIRISAYVNNVWQSFGSTCSITTPANIPTTQLSSNVCNTSVAARGTVFTFDAVPGATNYRLLLVNAAQSFSVTNTRNSTSTNFALSYVSTTQAGITYDVKVAAYSGGVWGAYGSVCQVTALSAKDNGTIDFANSRTVDNNAISADDTFEFNVYPNPNQGLFNIELNAVSQVVVTNTIGQVVLNETMEIGTNNLSIESQPTGIYFVKVIQNGKQQTLKLIKE